MGCWLRLAVVFFGGWIGFDCCGLGLDLLWFGASAARWLWIWVLVAWFDCFLGVLLAIICVLTCVGVGVVFCVGLLNGGFG